MNIFILDEDPKIAASYHCDKHVVKMIVETAQILSTAHRVLDGCSYYDATGKREILRYDHPEPCLYHATHINHPCNTWVRKTISNYYWTYHLLVNLLNEYELRYKKVHKVRKDALEKILSQTPENLGYGPLTPFVLAMPDIYKTSDPVESYRNYYIGDKKRFAKWNYSTAPDWI